MAAVVETPQVVATQVETVHPPGPLSGLWRFSVDQYHELLRKGILQEGDPIELLDGLLVRKMTKNPPHRTATELTRRVLDKFLPSAWHSEIQQAMTLPRSEPEPDVMLVRGRVQDYPDRNPGPADVALVVEVADASLAQDQGLKKRLYAEAGVPVYWIVNLVDRRLEVYTQPSGPAPHPDYRLRRDYADDESAPLLLDGQEVGRAAVRDLLA